MRCEAIEFDARPTGAALACIGCGCTEDQACVGGCSWVSLDPPLCSACAEIAEDIERLHDEQHAGPAGSFEAERCPASPVPALHARLWLDETSGYCTRCRQGFIT